MSTPLPTTGISGGISETGVATIEVPMFVETLAEALSVLPNLGIGIPYRSRSFTQEDDGGYKVTLHFEGIANEAPSDDQVTFELDTSMAEDPIQTHPFFDTLKTRYAWDAAKEQFAETLPEASGQQTALSGSGKNAWRGSAYLQTRSAACMGAGAPTRRRTLCSAWTTGSWSVRSFARPTRQKPSLRPSCAASARSWTSRRALSSSRLALRRPCGMCSATRSGMRCRAVRSRRGEEAELAEDGAEKQTQG